MTHSTFSDNAASNQGGAIYASSPVTLENSILADIPSGGNCSGTIVDGGGNLSTDASCAFSDATSQNSVASAGLLSPLAANGGPTQTFALPSGSPAIDAAVAANCTATDQRGVLRPQGPQCDSGAFELDAGPIDTDDDGIPDALDVPGPAVAFSDGDPPALGSGSYGVITATNGLTVAVEDVDPGGVKVTALCPGDDPGDTPSCSDGPIEMEPCGLAMTLSLDPATR